MIKSHELSVGNALMKNGVVVIIDGRSIFDIWGFELKGVTEMSYSGIPISVSALKKIGYTECPIREDYFIIEGHVIWLCNDVFLCDKNGVVLKTIHQVQNLYQNLCLNRLQYKV